MIALIWLLMSKRRFHRSSKNWCRYQIDTISHVCVDDDWHYVVEDPYATKPRQTPSYQAYSVNKGSLLYTCFEHYFTVRGEKRSNALFLIPLKDWIVQFSVCDFKDELVLFVLFVLFVIR